MNMAILSLILCLTFIAAMIRKNGGVLESISSTAYLVSHKIAFTLTLLIGAKTACSIISAASAVVYAPSCW